jgi:small GTP-binding protein
MTTPETCHKVVVVGCASVGKSALVQRLTQNTFHQESISTCASDFYTYSMQLDSGNVRLQIWDTAGQERFRSISKQYFRNSVGAILVFDLTSLESFEALTDWLTDLQDNCVPNAYILLVANKSDLGNRRQVGWQEIKDFADRNKLESVETSALSGNGVKEAFARLAFEISNRVRRGTILMVSPTKPLPVASGTDERKSGKKSQCC